MPKIDLKLPETLYACAVCTAKSLASGQTITAHINYNGVTLGAVGVYKLVKNGHRLSGEPEWTVDMSSAIQVLKRSFTPKEKRKKK